MTHRAPLIGVLVAVLLTVGYWFGLYKPALEEQAALEAETAELEARQRDLRNEIAHLEEIRRDEDRYRATADLLRSYVPDGVTQATVVRQMQQTADKARVEITSVTFTAPTPVVGAPETTDPDTVLASIGINMVVEGGYFQTVDFFRRVEQDVPRAVLNQSVNLTEGERGFPSLATTWAGQLFAVVPVAATVAPDDPGIAPGEEATDEDAPTGAGDEGAGTGEGAERDKGEPAEDPGASTARGTEEGNRS